MRSEGELALLQRRYRASWRELSSHHPDEASTLRYGTMCTLRYTALSPPRVVGPCSLGSADLLVFQNLHHPGMREMI